VDKRWQKLDIRKLERVKGMGPEGWSRAVELVLSPS